VIDFLIIHQKMIIKFPLSLGLMHTDEVEVSFKKINGRPLHISKIFCPVLYVDAMLGCYRGTTQLYPWSYFLQNVS
jgi:hypothetical protein